MYTEDVPSTATASHGAAQRAATCVDDPDPIEDMSTNAGFAQHVCDQLRGAGGITAKQVFGEYALYRNGKIVALACDNQLGERGVTASFGRVRPPAWR